MIYAYRRINPGLNTIVPLFEHDWPETPPPEPWDDYDLDGVRDVKTDCTGDDRSGGPDWQATALAAVRRRRAEKNWQSTARPCGCPRGCTMPVFGRDVYCEFCFVNLDGVNVDECDCDPGCCGVLGSESSDERPTAGGGGRRRRRRKIWFADDAAEDSGAEFCV